MKIVFALAIALFTTLKAAKSEVFVLPFSSYTLESKGVAAGITFARPFLLPHSFSHGPSLTLIKGDKIEIVGLSYRLYANQSLKDVNFYQFIGVEGSAVSDNFKRITPAGSIGFGARYKSVFSDITRYQESKDFYDVIRLGLTFHF